MRDGRRRRIPARAARRMPPKRCRIICIGGPIATPTGATRAWLPERYRSPPREAAAGSDVESDRTRDVTDRDPPALRGGISPRGISGSSGSHHRHRSTRRAERRRRPVVRALRARSARRTCSDSWSTSRRRASSSPRRGATSSVGRSSPSGRRFAPAATWGRSTSSWWIPTTTPTASPTPSSRRSSGRHRTRAAASSKRRCRRTRRSGPAGNDTVSSKAVRERSVTWPRSGPPHAAEPMNAHAELRDRAGAAGTTN